jgi:hypothetical protein
VALFVLAGTAIEWRGSTIGDPGEADGSEDATTFAESQEIQQCSPSQLEPVLLVSARAVRPQEGELDVDLALCPGRAVEDRVVARGFVTRNDALVFELAGFEPPVHVESPAVPLGRVVFGSRRGAAVSGPGDFVLPLYGKPDAYPLDWFTFAGQFTVRGPAWLAEDLPSTLQVSFITLPGVGDFDFELQPKSLDAGVVRLHIDRERSTKRFVIGLLALPFLLAAVLFGLTTLHGVGGPADSRNLVLAVAAAIFALLPIRQVLVPSDVEGLTTVDWCLGAAVLVFMAIAVWSLGLSMAAGRKRP